jgi:hypothetical protein
MLDQDPGSALLAPSIDNRVVTCPECGHEFSAKPGESPDHTVQTLIAVCDVLVVKALEKMGNYLIRAERSRYNEWGDKPYYLVHTHYEATDQIVTKALKGAWDVVPLILDTHGPKFDAALAVAILDQYVHDLAVTNDEHHLNVLAMRLRSGLGLPIFIVHPG